MALRHPSDHTKYRSVSQAELSEIEPLLVDVLARAGWSAELPDLDVMAPAARPTWSAWTPACAAW